ncbi:hypothetical protein [Aquisalibacillus elongatus]|uniref:Uncharacterized protein n=1 Tax=Aquisalibacillus elongatus TaxID=485577 RepID=A0A3N5B9M8_9BACI|nr:hypothetical protein [Aquisalibacillus elongatus]RPF52170.1 hypothetical protein EDC24_2160 [Aquisalibacillus elongatus]
MSDEHNHHIDQELKEFPEYQMDPKKVDEIYENIMEEAKKIDQQETKRKTMNKWAVALTSAAALLIIALISVPFIGENMNDEMGEGSANEDSWQAADDQDGEQQMTDDDDDVQPEEEAESEPQSTEEIVTGLADEVIELLSTQTMDRLSGYVDEEKGLLFSPYLHVDEEAVVMEPEEVANFFNDESTYVWGQEAGSGRPIELTPAEYYNEWIMDQDYKDADQVRYEKYKNNGNIPNNLDETFPDAKVVEYFVESTDGLNWGALNLVFAKNKSDEWKLVAIVHDQWTP